MAELMVYHEGHFERTRVVAVYERDDGVVEITTTAEKGIWFNPDDPNADEKGLVCATNMTATTEFHLGGSARREEYLEILNRWRDQETVVTGFVSFESQAVGYVCRREDGSVESVALKMPREDLDRVD